MRLLPTLWAIRNHPRIVHAEVLDLIDDCITLAEEETHAHTETRDTLVRRRDGDEAP
jgi:hypothetical protein